MPDPTIVLNVLYTLKPSMQDAFIRTLTEDGVLDRVRQEPGCLQYELFAAAESTDRMVLLEHWDGKSHIDAHIAGSNFKTMQAIEKNYVADVDVRQYLV